MTILRSALLGLLLSAFWLCLPSGSGAVPTSQLCQGVGNHLWEEWRGGTLPQTDASIDKLLQVKQDCPQLSGSMDRMANDIKAHRQRQSDAHRHVKKAGEKSQNSIYDSGGWPGGSRGSF